MHWEVVIGLEVHTQLRTRSKIFSSAATAFGAAPNTQACAVDIALPGVLPVMNQQAAHLAVRFGLAIDAKINRKSVFARKNYFYPDLPKGYQISQLDLPIVGRGKLVINTGNGPKTIAITRAHLEEDAGKSLHEDFHGMTGIDLNRAGTPLLEIVSEPDLRSAAEAVVYLRKLHTLVQYIGICDGNMQEGSFRCDANVSVRPHGQIELGTRSEIKNINSFRFVERAINYEIRRQIELLEDGGKVVQETRLYDSDRDETRPMRSKEEAQDYRYFPDPDLPPMVLDQDFIDAARAALPELPDAKLTRFMNDYRLTTADATALCQSRPLADYFETASTVCPQQATQVANWINGDLTALLNKQALPIENCPVPAIQLGQLVARISDGTISGKAGKKVLLCLWADSETAVDTIIDRENLAQVTDNAAIEEIVDEVLALNPEQQQQYRDGQVKILGYLVGQVMKASYGKANPQQVNQLLKQRLKD
ncbi:MAG TPA: Asp-tRNA(Asn)/Glu-tRNA(Gln) amidotransferase subunit GatB [Gammaproteobacteria bacterium]|nr:Asp-tRNA(Asn)/Glu-tRNA(Gln) amidotransferase subunit GatB [Gammaproteobacteria bacterium]